MLNLGNQGNGGKGGKGGNGANGLNGTDGRYGNLEKATHTQAEPTRNRTYTPNHDYFQKFESTKHFYEDKGTDGTAGGNGGQAGTGGCGGYPGIILLEGLNAPVYVAHQGENGMDGQSGTGGMGGLHGKHCQGYIVFEKMVDEYWENRKKRGQKGPEIGRIQTTENKSPCTLPGSRQSW